MSKIIISDTQEIDVNCDGIIFNSDIAENDLEDIISRLQQSNILGETVIQEKIKLQRQYESEIANSDISEPERNLLQEIEVSTTMVWFISSTAKVKVFPPNNEFTAENLVAIERIIRDKYRLDAPTHQRLDSETVGSAKAQRTTNPVNLPVSSNNVNNLAEAPSQPESSRGFLAILADTVIWAAKGLWNFVTYPFRAFYRFVTSTAAPIEPPGVAGNNVASPTDNTSSPWNSSLFSVAAWTPSWCSVSSSHTQNTANWQELYVPKTFAQNETAANHLRLVS